MNFPKTRSGRSAPHEKNGASAQTSSGTRRRKKARRSVLIADWFADWTITIGGLLVIIAVFGILVFLVGQVLPLFSGGKVLSRSDSKLSTPLSPSGFLNMDEHLSMTAALDSAGKVRAFHPPTGRELNAPSFDFQDKQVTAIGFTVDRENLAFGFVDGTVRLGTLAYTSEILTHDQLPLGLEHLDERDSTDGTTVYSFVTDDQVRRVSLALTLDEEVKVSKTGSAIRALDYRIGGVAERPTKAFVSLDDSGEVSLSLAQSKKNLLSQKLITAVETAVLPPTPEGSKVTRVLLNSKADTVFLGDLQGRVFRYNTQQMDTPILAEAVSVLPQGVTLTALGFLLGEESLVVGGSDGSLNIFFRLRREGSSTPDGISLVRTRTLEPHKSAVMSIVPSRRDKTFLTADGSGEIWVRHGTSEKTLARLEAIAGQSGALGFSPRADGVLAVDAAGQASLWNISLPHPDTSLHTLFGRVWYEGYPKPGYTWQSSAATDDFEPKLSLIPLIFGTVKATFYSLLFAIPIALLAAIYTSEFLSRRLRAVVKPLMEMMASLPSVVLGFVAALVLAPLVETWIAAIILAFVVIPISLIGAAYLWQFIPPRLSYRLQGTPKMLLICLTVAAAAALAYQLGPAFELLFFNGSFTVWVNGALGTAVPLLFLILLPLSLCLASVLGSRLYGRRLTMAMRRRSHLQASALSIVHWLGTILFSAGLSYGLAVFLSQVGFDARGTFVNTYAQRNTLIVGFAMGFAVIPIIYTLAEDALSSVPEHLRAASLGCGATPWQTAIFIVLPTAVSGIFSAIMIGMGRAVGETMIVVMATGNTPIMDWNIFNGLRALSANIAVELPEAVKDGSLYRVLFLSGLVLFAMTFVINTLAEVIRQRFRKRARQM